MIFTLDYLFTVSEHASIETQMDAADMASQIEAAEYDPARRQNPDAAERALEYATSWGSADTALKQIESGHDYPDALMRSVCDELRQIRFLEAKAAAALAHRVAA